MHRGFTIQIPLGPVPGQESPEGKWKNLRFCINDLHREDCISDDDAPEEKRRKKQKAGLTPDVTTRKPAAALSNGFKCPGGAIGVHLALPHPKDCRLYYVCLDGITPSDAGCTHGTVFNPTTHQCDNPGNVEGEI